MNGKFPEPFEFLNEASEEYIRWFIWAFEKKYGRGSWKKTLEEKWKALDGASEEGGTARKEGGHGDEWR